MATYIGNIKIFNAKELEQFFIANNIEDSKKKRALLLNSCNEETYRILHSLCVPDNPTEKTYAELIGLFNKYYAPEKSYFSERYKFYNASKVKSETMAEWAARVRNLGSKCNFGSELLVTLRDRFIMGLEKGPILDRLFEEDVSTLAFDKAVEIAVNKEAARHNFDL